MNKVFKNIIKYTSLTLSVGVTGFIIYQSAIDSTKSGKWEAAVANFLTNLFNNGFNMKQEVKIIDPESVETKLTNYTYNQLSGYKDNELPLGCTKQLVTNVLPSNTTNKSVKYEAYPSDKVNLVQAGNYVYIEGLNKGEVTIKGTSTVNNALVSSYTFNVIDLKAPHSFEVSSDDITIKQGESSLLDILVKEDKLKDDPLLTCRYYNNKKLIYTFDNNEHASIDENAYIKGLSVGTSRLTISNGDGYSKDISINVIPNDKTLVNPISMTITGNDYCYIGDMDYDRSEKGLHNTPLQVNWGDITPSDTNVIWESSNPLVATIDNKGIVRGFRNTSSEDVNFVITATSVMDPNIKATFNMTSKHVLPTNMVIKTNKTTNDDGSYPIYKGESISFTVSFEPSNVTKKNYQVLVDNEYVNPVISGSSFTLFGKDVGGSEIIIKSIDNPSLITNIKTNITEKPFVNEDNAKSFSQFVRKVLGGHATLFLVDSMFLTIYIFTSHFKLRRKNKYFLPIALLTTNFVGFVLAGISEWIQYYIPGRTCLWNDVCIDMNGWLLGFAITMLAILIALLIRYLIKKHKTKMVTTNE